MRTLRSAILATLSLSAMVSAASAQTFDVEEATIADIQEAIAAGTSCVDIVTSFIERIRTYEFRLNSITYLNPDALEAAAALDASHAAGAEMGALFCVPVLLKDNVNTFDMPTSNGSIILRDAVPNADAFITAQIRAADAILLGKAAMGEFANNDYNTIDGVVTNAYSPLRSASGSSAGSAAALTGGLAVLAVGSDTSSSIRGPAAYAGVVGLRPTTGLWSRSGIAPKSFLFDTAGPMARTVRDVAILLGVADGRDDTDTINTAVYDAHPAVDGVAAGEIDYTAFLREDAFTGARIGVVRDFFVNGDPEVLAMVDEAIETMRGLGAEIIDINLDPEYFEFYIVNGSPNLRAPADYAFRRDFEDYLTTYFAPPVPQTVQEFIDIYNTTVARSERPVEDAIMTLLTTAMEHTGDEPERARVIDELLPAATAYKQSLFDDNDLDALIYPTRSGFPPLVNEPVLRTADPTYVPPGQASFIFTGYSSVGNPDITVPMGVGPGGLPAGLSFMGQPYDEGTILGLAYAFEQATHGRVPPDMAPLGTVPPRD